MIGDEDGVLLEIQALTDLDFVYTKDFRSVSGVLMHKVHLLFKLRCLLPTTAYVLSILRMVKLRK